MPKFRGKSLKALKPRTLNFNGEAVGVAGGLSRLLKCFFHWERARKVRIFIDNLGENKDGKREV